MYTGVSESNGNVGKKGKHFVCNEWESTQQCGTVMVLSNGPII